MSKLRIIIYALCLCGLHDLLVAQETDYPEEFYQPSDYSTDNNHPRATFGVRFLPTTGPIQSINNLVATQGVYVSRILPNSTAESMGIQVGDVITVLNDRTVSGVRGGGLALARVKIGQSFDLTIMRNGEKRELTGTMKSNRESGFRSMTDEQRMVYHRKMMDKRHRIRVLMQKNGGRVDLLKLKKDRLLGLRMPSEASVISKKRPSRI